MFSNGVVDVLAFFFSDGYCPSKLVKISNHNQNISITSIVLWSIIFFNLKFPPSVNHESCKISFVGDLIFWWGSARSFASKHQKFSESFI